MAEKKKKTVKKETKKVAKAKVVKAAPKKVVAKKPAKKVVKKETKKAAATKSVSLIPSNLKEELAESKIVTRGRIFVGKVISAKISKTVRVEWPRRHYIPKYERFEKRRTRVRAHNPESISAVVGDTVRISECRPISKDKKFVVIGKVEAKQ